MRQTLENLDEKLLSLISKMSDTGIRNAAKGFSSMLGETLAVTEPTVHMVPFISIPDLLGGPEQEAVGIYLRAEGTLSGQIMMVIPFQITLELVDLLLGMPVGTTQSLGTMERSALAELGNVSGTFFLNSIADATGMEIRPTPPAVMVDMVGAIMDILIASWDGVSEYVMLIQATFLRGDREIQAEFWMIPDHETLKEALKKNPQERI